MRMIIQDYSDEVAVGILGNVASAMDSKSKLLIAETVVPDRIDEASLHAATMDMFMFNCGGKERTKAGFEKILGAAGLRLEKIWQAGGTVQAVLEAVLS
jgi:hypothetical protein